MFHSWNILRHSKEKFRISTRPCNILYISWDFTFISFLLGWSTCLRKILDKMASSVDQKASFSNDDETRREKAAVGGKMFFKGPLPASCWEGQDRVTLYLLVDSLRKLLDTVAMRIFPSITSKFWLHHQSLRAPPFSIALTSHQFSRAFPLFLFPATTHAVIFVVAEASNRVLKWWRHKNVNCEILEFIRIFWKKNIWMAYLPKTRIVGKIVLELLVLFCSGDSVQILLNLTRFLSLFFFFLI